MARIDSLLGIAIEQGANELRVASGQPPKLLAAGVPKRFNMGAIDEETLRHLLGEILSTERNEQLERGGRAEATYQTAGGAHFDLTLTKRADGLDAVFFSASAGGSKAKIIAAPVSTRQPSAAASSFADSALVRQAIALGASDLHLVDGDVAMARVDGRLQRVGDEVVIDALAAVGVERSPASRDLSMSAGPETRARVHVFRSDDRNAVAIRFLGRTPMSLAALNLPMPLEDLIDLPHGLVVVCGATGSGKSTTLAALAQAAIARHSIALVSLEDPIEYVLVGNDRSIVRQREVGRDVPSMAEGLRDALREDPDILVVGEMRDEETIGLALTAAETGHLVIATLHSGSASTAIDRLVNAFGPQRQAAVRMQIAESLRAVVAQRLLLRARGNGRIPALEVLRMNHAAASLVREGKVAQLSTVLQAGRKEGMIALERCLADRVIAGDVRPDVARMAANDVNAFDMLLKAPR